MSSSSPSLSRRERERQMRRQAMLDAAQSVFAEKGYARATLDEIAERAEFGKGTLYNYFEGGKEALLFAVFDAIYDDIVGVARATFTPERVRTASLRTAFRELVVAATELFLERKDLFLILIKEAYRLALSDDADRVAFFRQHQRRLEDALLPALQAAAEQGTIRDLPLRPVAHMLVENVNGMLLHRAMADRDPETDCVPDGLASAEAAADFLTAMLLDGLLVTPVPSSVSSDA
jgi:AcrR family transcriptional regulator